MNPKTSIDLFNKIRSQFSNIQVGDESGLPTADPATAVFFEFEFKEEAGRMEIRAWGKMGKVESVHSKPEKDKKGNVIEYIEEDWKIEDDGFHWQKEDVSKGMLFYF